MNLRVEFYGLARQRAGTAHLELELPGDNASLAEALRELAIRLPTFAKEMIPGGGLHSALTANLEGQRFVSDPTTVICDGQCLLILSADAGG